MAEPKGPSGVTKALNAAWVRPFLFLIFIVVAWDLTIRVFRIPAYQIPAPGDVVAVVGAGPLGQLIAMCAPLFGCSTVVAIDVVPDQHQRDRQLCVVGAVHLRHAEDAHGYGVDPGHRRQMRRTDGHDGRRVATALRHADGHRQQRRDSDRHREP